MWRTNKHTNKEAETYKHKPRQGRSMLNKRNKETETKNGWIRVFRLEYAYTYIGPVYAAQLYAYTYFKYAYACREHAYIDTPRTLTQK